jgi:hypothetical protein
LTETLAKIRSFLSAKQIAISSHLSAYDKRHRGEFPIELLATPFGRIGLPLVKADRDSIRMLRRGDGHNSVKWQQFASAVDPVIVAKQPEETAPEGRSTGSLRLLCRSSR